MRIGIVTQPLSRNYGGILQNYALQQVLKRMGHEVWTISYNRFTWLRWANINSKVFVHRILGHHVPFRNTPNGQRRNELPLRHFIQRHISLTIPKTIKLERGILKKYNFDAIVVGSDQIWRPIYNRYIERTFLSFAKNLPLKRVAYAASFGTDKWEFTKKQTKTCSALAKEFDGISVREKSGIELCRRHLGVKAEHVLDPTLLLSAEDYTELCKDIPKREPFVFAYVLDMTEEKVAGIKSFAQRRNLPCVIKSADTSISKDDSIEKWLSFFRDAAFVITDSFHGTAFSINFNKDFYVYGNEGRGNSRFHSLLESFGLIDRMILSEIPMNEIVIDWEQVNYKKEEYKTLSEQWLKNQLKN